MKRIRYLIVITVLMLHVVVVSSLYAVKQEILSIQDVSYSYYGNYKGWLSVPDTGQSLYPAILYNYDQYIDWMGVSLSEKIGYDLKAFMSAFESWGYATLIPLERYHKLNALKGALVYLRNHSKIDASRIVVIGVGQGALLSILAMQKNVPVAGLVLLAPEQIHNTGHFSYSNIIRQMDQINVPILFISGKSYQRWKNVSSQLLYELLKEYNKDVIYKEYNVKKRWFWYTQFRYMTDIRAFINTLGAR